MKICFLADAFLKDPSTGINGAQVQMYFIAKGLAEKGWQIHYVAGTWQVNKFGKAEYIDGIYVHWYKLRRYPPLLNTPNILRLLKEINPDIVYNRGRSYLTGVSAWFTKFNNKKFVWASNGEDGCDKGKHIKRLFNKRRIFFKKLLLLPESFLNDRIYEWGIKRANLIVNQTWKQKKALNQNFKKEGVIIKSGHTVPQRLKPKTYPPIILWLANFSPVKQPEIFVNLAQKCKDLDCRFIMAGGTLDTGYLNRVLNSAKNLLNFEYRGELSLEESNALLEEVSILVNTSKREGEGISNTMVQAWLREVPVVTLLVDPDDVLKKNHIGFHSQSFEQLVKDVRYLIQHSDERKEMGKRAREFAIKEYNIDKIISDYEKTLKDIL